VTLRTHRLLCREPLHSDADTVLRIYSDVRTSARSPLAPLTTAAAACTMLEAWTAHWREYGWGTWAIAAAHGPDAVIGFGGLSWRDFDGARHPNLWYRFAPEVWGQGYATEFSGWVLRHAATASGLREVHSMVLEANPASIRVLEKLGMRHVGELAAQNGAVPSLHYRLELAA